MVEVQRVAARRRAVSCLAAVVVLAGGCVHGGGGMKPATATGPALAGSERSLFRVRFQGPEESGSLRLALYQSTRDRFQLRASDTFGRSLWDLSVADGVSRIVDHRAGRFCESTLDVRVPALALEPLPVEHLPDMLAGRLPVSPAAGESLEDGEFRDAGRRRWTFELAAGAVESWTLWDGDAPSLWWKRQDRGGVLSHRKGSQVRWRLVVSEPMTESLDALETPADFGRVDCSLLAQIGAGRGAS